MSNVLHTIYPYKDGPRTIVGGDWVFDDEHHGLVAEPFILGAELVIDLAAKGIPDAENGFKLVFSTQAFPGAFHARRIALELGGATYEVIGQDEDGVPLTGWLCPALHHYLPEPPESLYFRGFPSMHPVRKADAVLVA
ncbi:MAG: hypothetical protein LBK99_16630 [Opitutaceae bacterium]|jgi:hypothetical protein|nr:hypothetical protein [Opitutaceae bacterium]